jgi:hypothetical protein
MPSKLEQYLDEVSRPVAAEYRSEWREETRQHLEAIIAEKVEQGLNREEAVSAALSAFGNARRIGEGVAWEALKTPPTVKGLVTGFVLALVVAPAYAILSLLLCWGKDAGFHFSSYNATILWSLIAGPLLWAYPIKPLRAALVLGSVYLVVGAVAGLLSSQPSSAVEAPTFFMGLQGFLLGGTVAAVRTVQKPCALLQNQES